MSVGGGVNRDPEPAPNTPRSSPNPHQTSEPSSPEPSENHASPEGATPEQEEAREESEERTKGLLKAYQQTLNKVDDLPAVVWVPWGRKGVGRYFKVPYLRLFLRYFVTYHIGRSLDTLNRQLTRDRCALQRPRRQQLEARGCETLPSVVAFAALSDPDLLCGARCACDSASSAGIRKRILRTRPGRGDVEVRRELLEQSIGRR